MDAELEDEIKHLSREHQEFYRMLPSIAERIRLHGVPLHLEPYEVHIIDQVASHLKAISKDSP